MVSASVSNLILFIAAMIVAAAVAGTLVTSVQQVNNAVADSSVNTAEQIDTDTEIISDPGSDAVYDGTTVTLLVRNTGSRSLVADPESVDVLVDGQYVTNGDVTITTLDGPAWEPGSVVRIEAERTLDPGEHRAVVAIDGDRELLRFTT